jgi:hypothetical protein
MTQATETVTVVDLDEDAQEPDEAGELDQAAEPSATGEAKSGPVHNLW